MESSATNNSKMSSWTQLLKPKAVTTSPGRDAQTQGEGEGEGDQVGGFLLPLMLLIENLFFPILLVVFTLKAPFCYNKSCSFSDSDQ
jgi:hypothetical protein